MKIFINFWNILNKKEKIFFTTIIFFSIIQALLELIGIAAVIPLVTYLLKPEAIENLGFLSTISIGILSFPIIDIIKLFKDLY